MTVQTVQDCGRSVRVTTHALPVTVNQAECRAIIGLIDSAMADAPNEEVLANLLSARLHVKRAIKELELEPMAMKG